MLFLWTREPTTVAAGPRAGPWFAWFTTAVLLWRCRRRIAKLVFGASSSLRFLRRRRGGLVVSKTHHHHHHLPHQQQQQSQPLQVMRQQHQTKSKPAMSPSPILRRIHHQHVAKQKPQQINNANQEAKPQPKPQTKLNRRPRLKRLHAGDGPHMLCSSTRKISGNTRCMQISQKIYYRMTRSGRVYGKYPCKPPPVK